MVPAGWVQGLHHSVTDLSIYQWDGQHSQGRCFRLQSDADIVLSIGLSVCRIFAHSSLVHSSSDSLPRRNSKDLALQLGLGASDDEILSLQIG